MFLYAWLTKVDISCANGNSAVELDMSNPLRAEQLNGVSARLNCKMSSCSPTSSPNSSSSVALSKQMSAMKLVRGRCESASDNNFGRTPGTGSLGTTEDYEDHGSIKEEDEDQLGEDGKDNAFRDEEENATLLISLKPTDSFDQSCAAPAVQDTHPWTSSRVSSGKGESCSSYSSLNCDDGLSITTQECNQLHFLAAQAAASSCSSTCHYPDAGLPIVPPVNYQRKYSLTVPGEPRHMRTLGRHESSSRSPLNLSCSGLSHSELSTPSPSCSNSM